MDTINAATGAIVEALFAPIAGLPAQVSLVLWGALTGVLAAAAYRFVSNQRALRDAAAQARAQLFAVKLFKDDFRVILQSQFALLKATGRRLLHSLPPMIVLSIPIVLLLAQLSRWYEHRPLAPGEAAVVTVELAPEAWKFADTISLTVPQGIAVETPRLRDVANHKVYWRIRPSTEAAGTLTVKVGDEEIEKSIVAAEDGMPLSSRRPGPSWLERLLHPGEKSFAADSPIRGVELQYRERSTPIFGIDVPWWLTFFAASMIAAILVRPLFKVQF